MDKGGLTKIMTNAIGCLFALLVLASQVQAGIARDKLNDFYNNVESMRASFTQMTMDSRFNNSQETTGTLMMQRPGKFRWDYISPYDQSIIADGEKIWVYDKDLEQVTVNQLDAVIGNTPALLLSGGRSLDKNFKIIELESSKGLDWVELFPLESDTSFSSVRLAFGKTRLAVMELEDSFGQTTIIKFSNLENNPVLDSGTFQFVPPKGVDVIGEE